MKNKQTLKIFVVTFFLLLSIITVSHSEMLSDFEIINPTEKIAIFLLNPTNNQTVFDDEISIYGSFIMSDYSYLSDYDLLIETDDSGELIRVPMISPGFKSTVSLKDTFYGTHTINLYAVGYLPGDDTNEVIFAADSVSFERKLKMQTGGKIFMALAWLAIILLNVFNFIYIFKEREEKIVEPLEIDTEDD